MKMIDTYFDKLDAGREIKRISIDRDDPRYYNGSLYVDQLHAMVAQAKDNLRADIEFITAKHRRNILNNLMKETTK